MARLHLICDILHNSAASVPSAWKFRSEFQSRLGVVFDHLANIYHSFPGRMTAETFKKQITSIVDIWDDWIVFPPDFTAELRQRLDGAVKESEEPQVQEPSQATPKADDAYSSRFKATGFQLATTPAAPEANLPDGEAMDLASDGDEGSEDVDGIPVDDVDGEPVDGEPFDDVDGELLQDDIDGVAVDDDVDGMPIDDVDSGQMEG